jgi:hypothetical protein
VSLRLLLALSVFLAPALAAAADDRPRLVVLTDYFRDPDDKQSMIRLLLYANEFDLEAIVATSLAHGDGSVRPEWIRALIEDEYAAVFPNLRQHARPGTAFPEPAALAARVHAGARMIRKFAGTGKGFPVPYPADARDSRTCEPAENWLADDKLSAGAHAILRALDRADPRPLWVVIWGGGIDLAQAIWKIRTERAPAEAARLIGRLRVYQVSWQDTGAVWNWEQVPDLFLVTTVFRLYRGMLAYEEPSHLGGIAWVERNILRGHGALGAAYPGANAYGKREEVVVKEGDTPSFLHLLAPGLGDPGQPEWGGWGGRFHRVAPDRMRWVDGRDRHPGSAEPQREIHWTIGRWKEAIYAEFAARLDWCVQPFAAANHAPVAVLDGDTSRRVLRRTVRAREKISLSAAGSADPDGHTLSHRWWHYREPGTFAGELAIQGSDTPAATLVAPAVPAPATAHVILEVTDTGEPRLTSYRRVVLTIEP